MSDIQHSKFPIQVPILKQAFRSRVLSKKSYTVLLTEADASILGRNALSEKLTQYQVS